MMGRSHMLLSAACYLAIWRHAIPTPLGQLGAPVLGGAVLDGRPSLALMGLSLAMVTASALGPDIDKGGSRAARIGGWGTGALAWSLEHTVHHRGPLHSLLACVAAVLAGNAIGALLGVTGLGALVGFGWAAHLLGDIGTRRGVPLFWPVGFRVRPPVTFTTGTWQETVVLGGALAMCLVWGQGMPA